MVISGFLLPPVLMMLTLVGLSAAFLLILAKLMTQSVHIDSAGAWVALPLIGWWGGMAAVPIAELTRIGSQVVLPVFAVAFIVSAIHLHYVVPGLVPRIGFSGWGASLSLALAVAIATVAAGFVADWWVALAPGALFQGPVIPVE